MSVGQAVAIAASPADAAKMLGITRTRMFELLAAGEILSVRDGRRRLVSVASCREWYDRKLAEGAP